MAIRSFDSILLICFWLMAIESTVAFAPHNPPQQDGAFPVLRS